MITSRLFDTLSDGRPVTLYTLQGRDGAYAEILDLGATIRSLVVPGRDGVLRDVVLGFDRGEDYRTLDGCLGATVGRHANRMAGASFTLNGVAYSLAKNNGENNLHSGPEGYQFRLFRGEIQGQALCMHLLSPHMDQGFPGELRLTVRFTFDEDNALTIEYEAVSDRDTVVNLTNHSYFDLSAGENPMGQLLEVRADEFCENDGGTLPTGRLLPVEGTAFDFRAEKPVGQDVDREEEQLRLCGGYDHNFVLKNCGRLRTVALLRSPETGITMTTATDLPGLQVYSANFLSGPGKGGRTYGPRQAVCLETQFFPGAMAFPQFEKPILRVGAVYRHKTVYGFGLE